MKTFITVLVVTCWSGQCLATMTLGKRDCGTWLDKNPILRNAAEDWLGGYMTGLNAMWDIKNGKPADPLKQLGSAKQAHLWMDNYCKEHPLQDVADGGLELLHELAAKARKQ